MWIIEIGMAQRVKANNLRVYAGKTGIFLTQVLKYAEMC